ncbi:MAG: hypothetical protein HY700_04480 [Gemmatimonadetes bacterium]|nr:hypothetical protein [Gemmatimonadota bacterium]
MTSRLLFSLSTILTFAGLPLYAQAAPNAAPPAAAASGSPPARLDPTRIAPYRQSLRLLKVQGGTEEQMGTLEDRVFLGEDNGKPAIIRVQEVTGPTGSMLDSAVADPATLMPRRHSSHSEHRILRLEFSPPRVTGSFWEQGDPPFTIDDKVGDGVFDSNMLDVLISALPLAPGYTGRLTVYLYEAGGPVPVEVSVNGSEALGDQDTWAAAVTLNKRTAQYYVGKTEHRVVQVISTPAPGIEIRLVR